MDDLSKFNKFFPKNLFHFIYYVVRIKISDVFHALRTWNWFWFQLSNVPRVERGNKVGRWSSAHTNPVSIDIRFLRNSNWNFIKKLTGYIWRKFCTRVCEKKKLIENGFKKASNRLPSLRVWSLCGCHTGNNILWYVKCINTEITISLRRNKVGRWSVLIFMKTFTKCSLKYLTG